MIDFACNNIERDVVAMNKLIDGKKISEITLEEVRKEVSLLAEKGIKTCLAVIIVGNNQASRTYVNNKKKRCAEVGIESKEFTLPEETTEEALLELIEKLNNDPGINGILCQLPLPAHIDEKAILEAVSPLKDVDAFHPANVGRIMIGDYSFLPCTPAGIMKMLSVEGIDLCSKNCVVIGRSNIVGKPMAMLLLQQNATVTICHSKTKNLAEITRSADVLVSCVGRAGFVKADMVKEGAVVIDVGINRDENNKICGDVDFDAVCEKAGKITPVPGGVGPMTIATLMQNTLTASKLQNIN